MSLKHLLLPALLLLFTAHLASAHSSLESTLSFWFRPTGIDCQIYMSRSSAAVLLENPGENITIVRENFPDFESRLSANGPSLLSLTVGDAAPLPADASTASITDEDDICYRLHYPLPTVLPATLNIHGNYLTRVDDGHIGSIYVLSATDDQLAQGQIAAESPDLEVTLPALSPPLSPAATVKQLPAPRWPFWAALACSLISVAILGWKGFARRTANAQK